MSVPKERKRGKPPEALRINGRIFSVRYSPAAAMPDALGLCYFDKTLLEIRGDQSPHETRDTLLHELMHALRYTQGREYAGDVEEDFVRSLATGLMGVFQDNPEFAKWLITPTNP